MSERKPDPPLNRREEGQPYPGSLSLTEEVQGSRGSKLGSPGTSLRLRLTGAGQYSSSSHGTVWGPGGDDDRQRADWPAVPGVPEHGTSAPLPEGPVPSRCHGQYPPASLSPWSRARAGRAGRAGCLRVEERAVAEDLAICRALQILVPAHTLPTFTLASWTCGSTGLQQSMVGHGHTVYPLIGRLSPPPHAPLSGLPII